MTDHYIKTNTGKELDVFGCYASPIFSYRNLIIEFPNNSMAEIVQIVVNPEETRHIEEYKDGDKINDYDGYTNLMEIKNDLNNNVQVNMMRPEDPNDGVWEL